MVLLIGNWTYAISIMFSGAQFILSIFGMKMFIFIKKIDFGIISIFHIIGILWIYKFQIFKTYRKINKACILWTIYTVLAIDFY